MKAYILFLRDEKFIEKNKDVKIADLSNNSEDLLEYLIANVCTLRNTSEEFRYKWNELNAIEILLKLSKIKKSKLFEIHCLITYIMDDIQIETLCDIDYIIETMAKYLLKCKNDFQAENFDRITVKVKMNSSTLNCQVHRVLVEESKTSITLNAILNSFYKLSVNPIMKSKIYFKNELKSCLGIFLLKGNHFEIYFTLTLIAQLSFCPEVQNDLISSNEILNILDEVAKKDSSRIRNIDEKEVFSGIKKLAEIINWNLTETQEMSQFEGEHVLISYNTADVVMCLRIKDKLESFGFKVCMDLNNIQNSSIGVMENAVEQSYCVLICVTEKYRNSITCQVEALYAYRLNKKLIPMIMADDDLNLKVS